MRLILLLSALITSFFWTGCESVKPGEKSFRKPKPNIVIINVDDLGWKDLGFMGSLYYETPNIDKLATQGMSFTNAYAAAANCAPSRACMLSGVNTPRHGIYTVSSSERGNKKSRKLIPVVNNETLHDSVYTLPEMLRDNGYVTGTIGKWHLGPDPTTQGFQVNVAGNHRGMPGKGGYFSPYENKDIADGPEGEYLTDRLGAEAIEFIRDHRDTSFFLYHPLKPDFRIQTIDIRCLVKPLNRSYCMTSFPSDSCRSYIHFQSRHQAPDPLAMACIGIPAQVKGSSGMAADGRPAIDPFRSKGMTKSTSAPFGSVPSRKLHRNPDLLPVAQVPGFVASTHAAL